MRIPRDITGAELIRKLKPFGYSVTRQTGRCSRLWRDKTRQFIGGLMSDVPSGLGKPFLETIPGYKYFTPTA